MNESTLTLTLTCIRLIYMRCEYINVNVNCAIVSGYLCPSFKSDRFKNEMKIHICNVCNVL